MYYIVMNNLKFTSSDVILEQHGFCIVGGQASCLGWWRAVCILLDTVGCGLRDWSGMSSNAWDRWTRTTDTFVGCLFIFVWRDFDDTDVLFVSDVNDLILSHFNSVLFSIVSGINDPIDVTAEIGLNFCVYSNDKCSSMWTWFEVNR